MRPKTVPWYVKKHEQAIRCYTAAGETLYKRDSKKGGRKEGREEEREGGREAGREGEEEKKGSKEAGSKGLIFNSY